MELTKSSPYYDDYNADKLFYQMLAHPGSAEQAREFTQIQTILRNIIKGVGDALLQDGSIVSGCAISISSDRRIITVGEGSIYVGGIVHPVKSTTLTIQGKGKETIGVKLIESIVSHVEDPSLKDPAQGFDNYGQSGADRLKIVAQIVANDTQSFTIYSLEEGSLLINSSSPEVSLYSELLARRTYDESENYKVRGLITSVEPDTDDYVKAIITTGKAYVMGYEVNKPSTSIIKVPVCKDTRTTTNESRGFTTGTLVYSLNNKHVKAVSSVYGQVLKTGYITRQGFLGGSDRLPNTEVYDIQAINQGGIWNPTTKVFTGGTTFVKSIDFTLTDNGVDWSPALEDPDRQPTLGSTYQVAFKYTKEFIQFKDFSVTSDENKRSYINFGLSNGDLPVDGSLFLVTYNWYLERVDLLTLTKTGEFKIITGQPNKETYAVMPEGSLYDLPLAILKMPPNSSSVTVSNYNTTRVTMKEINSLIKRVGDMEYNLSMTNLDKEAESGEQATNLKGILTDGFVGFTKADVSHPQYNASLNLFTNEVTIPTDTVSSVPTINMAKSSFMSVGRLSLLPYSEQLGISQPYATDKMNINPYQVFSDEPQLLLSPDSDTWISESNMQIPIAITTNSSVTVPPKYIDDWWTSDSQRQLVGTDTNTSTSSNDAIKFFEQAITFMRPITIKVHGSKFLVGSELKAKFDGVVVNLSPVSDCSVGVKTGTIRVGALGTFVAEFNIPDNITTGSKTLVLSNDSNYAEATFVSQGIQRMFMSASVTQTNVVKKYEDLVGTKNKLVDSIANEALDLATQNKVEIDQLQNDLSQVEGRLTSVEDHISKIDDSIAELDREFNRQLQRIEDDITTVATETGHTISYIQANIDLVAGELMSTKQTALEAEMKATIAQSIAEQALLEASSATRVANMALSKATAAELLSQITAVNSDKALQIAQEARNTADEANKNAQDANLLSKTALTQVTNVAQVATYALTVANTLKTQVDAVSNLVNTHSTQISSLGTQLTQQQASINSLANQDAVATAERQALRTQIAQQNTSILAIKNQATANASAIATNTSNIAMHETEINALARYFSLTVSGSSVSQIWVDPLAQSFGFTQDAQITSIEVAFGDKGIMPITCQIREMSAGGLPTLTTLATTVLYPEQITASDDGSVMTKVNFETPAYCIANTQYCFVFMTEDTQYTLFTATMGQKDLETNQIVNKQPYAVGILFSSSNNVSWNTHQTQDLKFNLYVVSTEPAGVIEFNEVSNIQANQLVLAVDQLTPANTSIVWNYETDKVDSMSSPIQAYSTVTLADVTSKVKLTATMSGVPGNTVSPMIVTDTVGIMNLLRELTATYVSKLVSLSQPYTDVKQIIDAKLPSGTSLKMMFSPDDGVTWLQGVKNNSLTEQISLYYSRYTFESKLVRAEPAITSSKATAKTTGGSLPNATTLFYLITGTNSQGETTGKSFSVTTNGTSGSQSASVDFNLTGVFEEGITGFKIYRGISASSLSLKYVSSSLATTFTDNGSDTGSSIDTQPTENTATYTSDKFRAKFVLNSDSPTSQPKVQRFINIMK